MATPRPNHTQIPNDLLGNIERGNIVEPGLMAKLEGSQLKVYLAVCRMTIGYHQESRRASFSMIETFTGLSRPAVNSAAKALEEMNLIERTKDGGVTLWQLAVNSVNQDEVVNSVNQQDDYGQVAVNSGNQLVNSVNQTSKLSLPPSKKETEKKPKKENTGGKPQTEKQKLSREMFSALATLCHYDLAIIGEKERGQLNQAEKKMRENGYKPPDLDDFSKWWYENDWRGVQGQPPTLNDVRASWGKFKNGVVVTKPVKNGANYEHNKPKGRTGADLDKEPVYDPYTGKTEYLPR